MIAQVSAIMPHKGNWRIAAKVGDKSKGYEYAVKRQACLARSRLIKRLKADGFKVWCV